MTERVHCGRPRRRNEPGAAAVEFALVLPILLILVFGIIQYGFYFWSMQGGSAAAREAARRAAIGEPVTCAAFRTYVRDRIGVTGNAATAQIKRSYTNGPGNTDPAVEVGDVVTVSVSFQSYDFHFPFVPFMNGGIVSQSADSRVENVPSAPEVCA